MVKFRRALIEVYWVHMCANVHARVKRLAPVVTIIFNEIFGVRDCLSILWEEEIYGDHW